MSERTAGEMLERIRLESRNETAKGAAFERLFHELILNLPDFEVDDAWSWKEWAGPREAHQTAVRRQRHRLGGQTEGRQPGGHPVQVLQGGFLRPQERNRLVSGGLKPAVRHALDSRYMQVGQKRRTNNPKRRNTGQAHRLSRL